MKLVRPGYFVSGTFGTPQFAYKVYEDVVAKLDSAGVRFHMLHVVTKGNDLHVNINGPAARVRHRQQFTVGIVFDAPSQS